MVKMIGVVQKSNKPETVADRLLLGDLSGVMSSLLPLVRDEVELFEDERDLL